MFIFYYTMTQIQIYITSTSVLTSVYDTVIYGILIKSKKKKEKQGE